MTNTTPNPNDNATPTLSRAEHPPTPDDTSNQHRPEMQQQPTSTALSTRQAVARVQEHPGLSEQQRKFLARRVLTETDARAAAGVCAEETAARWKADPVFLAEYQRILAAKRDDLFERVQDELARVAQQVPATVADLLTAETPIVDKTGAVVGSRPDWQARARGAEITQRAAGKWNPPPPAGSANDSLARLMEATASILEQAKPRPTAPQIIEGTAREADSGSSEPTS